MRHIFLDTETTGMPAKDGHRIIEIGCVEMLDRELTDQHFHQYINPERAVDEGAYKVHGISDGFLADKPKMAVIIDEFLKFIQGSNLIIHNAAFDVGFLNHELEQLGRTERIEHICKVTDTLAMARKKHPGARASLDALAKRYHITQFNRELHGALLDSEILARVYLAMTGGQTGLGFASAEKATLRTSDDVVQKIAKPIKIYEVPLSDTERELHQRLINCDN